jgi:DNA-binding winged helix-turn-helix (wHTH) protein/TolB-like protein/tetratricopeptide (TPR) repeat protein
MKDFSKTSQIAEESRVYQFGPYRLYPDERVLRRESRLVPLTPKALETLLVLVRNSGRVVTKEELLQAVWPGTFVEEGTLAQNILTVRKTLDGLNCIQTVPRRGYRFSATIERQGIEGPPARPARRWHWAAIGAVLAGLLVLAGLVLTHRHAAGEAEIRSLAVLPFRSLQTDSADADAGLGMADVLINRLGSLRRITVRPTAAIRRYADALRDPLAVGRELRVDAVLDTNFQRDGARVRVTAELWRVRDGVSLWSGKFDRGYDDLFSVEDAIAEDVAGGLLRSLTTGERMMLSKHSTVNPEAWRAYLRGIYFWNRRTPEGHQRAIQAFEEATRIDSNYALAYAGLADAYALLGSNPNTILPRAEAMSRARAAAEQAIQLDDTLAEAHTPMAFIHMHYDWDFAAAEKEFQRAIDLNPSYPTAHQWHALNLIAMGHAPEAIAELEWARELDPMSLIISTDLAEFYLYAGRYDDAVAEARRVLEVDPHFDIVRHFLSMALAAKRAYAEASEAAEGMSEGNPARLTTRASVEALAGHTNAARQWLQKALDRPKTSVELKYQIAAVYGSLGDADAAVRWLEQAVAERNGSLILVDVDPEFASMRQDPRFRAIVARVGLVQTAKLPTQ